MFKFQTNKSFHFLSWVVVKMLTGTWSDEESISTVISNLDFNFLPRKFSVGFRGTMDRQFNLMKLVYDQLFIVPKRNCLIF